MKYAIIICNVLAGHLRKLDIGAKTILLRRAYVLKFHKNNLVVPTELLNLLCPVLMDNAVEDISIARKDLDNPKFSF